MEAAHCLSFSCNRIKIPLHLNQACLLSVFDWISWIKVSSRLKLPRGLILLTAAFPGKSSLIESLLVWENDSNTTMKKKNLKDNQTLCKKRRFAFFLPVFGGCKKAKLQIQKNKRFIYAHEVALQLNTFYLWQDDRESVSVWKHNCAVLKKTFNS